MGVSFLIYLPLYIQRPEIGLWSASKLSHHYRRELAAMFYYTPPPLSIKTSLAGIKNKKMYSNVAKTR